MRACAYLVLLYCLPLESFHEENASQVCLRWRGSWLQALHYDVRRGPHSVGSHVRDAAAYVTWAFARAYSSVLLKEHLREIAPALLTIACYDREVLSPTSYTHYLLLIAVVYVVMSAQFRECLILC